MSKKDYIAIANIFAGDIASARGPVAKKRIANVGRSIADYCASENPHFDRDRFYIAAGIARDPSKGP